MDALNQNPENVYTYSENVFLNQVLYIEFC